MPIPGQEILRRISEFAASESAVEQRARQSAQDMSAEIDRIVTTQSEAFRELAQLYLPRLEDDVVRDGWSEIQSTVNSIILRKEDARRQLTARAQQTAELRTSTETRWKQACDRVNELTAKCDTLARQLSESLASDSDFQSLAKSAAEGQARLEKAQANLTDVESEAKRKLPAYEQSSLFRYLRDCEFGSETYARRGLTRRLDRWVSRLINYPEASIGYKFLSSAPRQMRSLIVEQQAIVKMAMDEVERRQTEASEKLGLPQVQLEGSQARGEQESAALAAESARKAEELARHQLAELDSPDCQYYRDALTAFQNLIQRTERSLVDARAAQTPELTDDQVVARVKYLDEQVMEKKRQLDQFHQAAEMAAQRTSRINELASKCRRAQFDHPRRIFEDGFDLESHVKSLVAGTVDADQVYQEMYRRQRLDSPVADQAAAALQGPMAQILLQTMANAAGAALGTYAARAGQQHRVRPHKKDWF